MKKIYFILAFVILVGAFIRLQGVFTNSFAFTYDVGRDLLTLWNMQFMHKFSLIGATTGLPGVFYGPWWYLTLFPFFVLFSGNPQWIAFLIALFGILTIIFAYILGRKVDGVFLGLVFAALVSVSPSLVSISSQIWNPYLIPFFVVFVLYCLYKIYSQKQYGLRYFFFWVFFWR